jgi:hypothetical protein
LYGVVHGNENNTVKQGRPPVFSGGLRFPSCCELSMYLALRRRSSSS